MSATTPNQTPANHAPMAVAPANETLDGRIASLERTVEGLHRSARRSRMISGALASVVAALLLVGARQAAQPPQPGKPTEEIVVRKLSIVDAQGKVRIIAGTDDGGGTFIGWRDADGKRRIGIGTDKDGAAAVAWFDAQGLNRIKAAVAVDGAASIDWFDTNERLCFMIGTDKFGRIIIPKEGQTKP